MTSLSSGVVDAVVRSYDFSRIGVLLDVGGGEGVLLATGPAANPSLCGILFDQPHVVRTVGALLERAGVADRCEVVGGSFFEAVPLGADAYLLKSVIHDWYDDVAIEILRACRAAMDERRKLLVVERVIRSENEPDPAKFSDLNMLVIPEGKNERPLTSSCYIQRPDPSWTISSAPDRRITSPKVPRYNPLREAPAQFA